MLNIYLGKIKNKEAIKIAKNSKGMPVWGWIFLMLVIVGSLGSIVYFQARSTSLQEKQVEQIEQKEDLSASCDVNKQSTVQAQLFNTFANPDTQIAGNVYLKDMTTGEIFANATTTTSGWTSIATTAQCGSGHDWKLYAVNMVDTSGSAESDLFKITEKTVSKRLYTSTYAKAQVRVKDLIGGDDEFMFADSTAAGTNATSATDLNTTNVFEDAAAADIAVAAGGTLKAEIFIASATARKYASDEGELTSFDADGKEVETSLGLKTYGCVQDGTGDEWDTDSVIIADSSGAVKPNVYDNIDDASKKLAAVKNSDGGCYEVAPLSSAGQTLIFSITADTEIDTSGDDVTLCFFSEGAYLESKNGGRNIEQGIAKDDSSSTTVVYNSETPCLVFNVQ